MRELYRIPVNIVDFLSKSVRIRLVTVSCLDQYEKKTSALPHAPEDEQMSQDLLFVPIRKFRERFTEVMCSARVGKTVVIHAGPKPRAFVRREFSEEGILPRLDQRMLEAAPQKHLQMIVDGVRFLLVDEMSDVTEEQIVLQFAGAEWAEITKKQHQATVLLRTRKWQSNNKGVSRAYYRAWYKKNAERERVRSQQRCADEREKRIWKGAEEFAQELQVLVGGVVVPRFVFGELSGREKQLFLELLRGLNNQEIASEWDRHLRTVTMTRANLFKKLDIPLNSGSEGLKGFLKG